jgi:transcriptional regulator with XRE-family HTH domain
MANPYSIALGSILKEIREAKQLSKWAVEEDTLRQVRHGDLTAWETGRREMRVATLARLCAFYDVPTAVVLDRADSRYRAGLKPAVAEWRARNGIAPLTPHQPSEVA